MCWECWHGRRQCTRKCRDKQPHTRKHHRVRAGTRKYIANNIETKTPECQVIIYVQAGIVDVGAKATAPLTATARCRKESFCKERDSSRQQLRQKNARHRAWRLVEAHVRPICVRQSSELIVHEHRTLRRKRVESVQSVPFDII